MTNESSSLLLLGVGTAGCSLARRIATGYAGPIRTLTVDTDAAGGGQDAIPFVLLGANRFSGHGSGGSASEASLAFMDAANALDEHFQDVRLAVVVTCLGGGTGSGMTANVLARLHELGVTTLLFATLPFSFEGEARVRNASTSVGLLEKAADASVFLPMDDLTDGFAERPMAEAMAHAAETLASGVTLFWRLLASPGYLRLDAERLRAMLPGSGRARFAVATAKGEDRADAVVSALVTSPLLVTRPDGEPVGGVVAGVLAGDDLRLAEIGVLSSELSKVFAPKAELVRESPEFVVATVNDEARFGGTLSVVLLVFERSLGTLSQSAQARSPEGVLRTAAHAGFGASDGTIVNGENLDEPTYLRHHLKLDR